MLCTRLTSRRRAPRAGRRLAFEAQRCEPRMLLAANLLDVTFGGGDGVVSTDFRGRADHAVDVAVLPDGKILVAGTVAKGPPGGSRTTDFALARYNPDGTPDTTFGTGGKVTTDFHNLDDVARAMAVLPDGKVVVAGRASRASGEEVFGNFALVRYNADGSLDATFERDGKAVTDTGGDDGAADVLVLPDGDVLAVGTASAAGGDPEAGPAMVAVRYNADGTRDRNFGAARTGIVTTRFDDAWSTAADAATLTPDGKLLVAGSWNGDVALARYRLDGTLDTSFGGGDGLVTKNAWGDDSAGAVAVLPDGDVLVAGYGDGYGYYSYDPPGFVATRYNADGSTDTGFGGGDGIAIGPVFYQRPAAFGLALLPRGGFLATAGRGVARFNVDGSIDPTFDGQDGLFDLDAMAEADGLAVQSGRPVVVGCTSFDEDVSDVALARLKSIEVTGDDNDQIGEAAAAAVGVSRFGRIGPGTDVDMFKFGVAAGQQVGLDVDRSSGSALDPILRLFDARGVELAASDDAPGPGEAATTTESYLRRFIRDAGTYYVAVSGSPNGSYNPLTGTGDVDGSAGAYRLTITNIPLPADGDDQVAEAAAVAVGQTTSGAVTFETDVDLFKFTASAGQQLGLDVDQVSGGGATGGALNSVLRLFDAAGTELAVSDDDAAPGEQGGPESYIRHTFADAGTYYVGVSGSGNAGYDVVRGTGDGLGATGGYLLSVVNIPVDPDDQVSEAIALPLGGSRDGQLSATTDVDMYRIEGTAGRPVAIHIDLPAGSGVDSRLRLFSEGEDGQFQEVADTGYDDWPDPMGAGAVAAAVDSTADEPGEAHMEFLPKADGTYYVGVSTYGNGDYDPVTGENDSGYGPKGAYAIRLTALPTDADDQISEAAGIDIGSTTAGAVSPATDVDLYAFEVEEGQTVSFDVDRPADSALDSYLRVFHADGWEMAANNDGAAPGEAEGPDAFARITFDSAGTYYVGVSGAGNEWYDASDGIYDQPGSTGTYTLVLRDVVVPPDPDDQISEATPATLGSTSSGEIAEPTDVDVYAVTVRANQVVRFEVDTLSYSFLRLFEADGDALAASYDDGSNVYIRSRFDAAGTYYIAVSSDGNPGYDPVTGDGDEGWGGTGRYELRIIDLGIVPPDADDQIGEAARLTPGVATDGRIDPIEDVDMYRLEAAAGQEMVFTLDRSFDARLRLFDGDGQELASTDYSDLRFGFDGAGTYYVGVSLIDNDAYDPVTGGGDRASEWGEPGPYTLTVLAMPPDGDDQISEAVALGTGAARDGTIDGPFDVDVYSVRVSAGQRVGFDIDLPAGSGLDSYIRIFDSGGGELWSSDDDAAPGEEEGAESYAEYVFASGGTYYVGVSDARNPGYEPTTGRNDSAGNTGRYTLRLS